MRNLRGRGGPCFLVAGLILAATLSFANPAYASSADSHLSPSPHWTLYHALPAEYAALTDITTGNLYASTPWLGTVQSPRPSMGSDREASWNATTPGSSGGLSPMRSAIWGAISLTSGVAAFNQSQSAWGESRGKFHFKNDFLGDGMALSDETSHLFAAYRLTQVVDAGYRWIGMDRRTARKLAAVEAWLWMFAVEYPIDAYNPGQGFGVSDMLFNTAGVLAAYHRSGQTKPRWDVKISVKRQFFEGDSRVIAYTDKQYDDYIYWLTVRPIRNRYVPLLLGAGYSTTHGANEQITKELNLGIGTSLEEIGGLFGKRTASYLRPLNFFFINFRTTIGWR